jgi:5-(carboxyamino)imidazole ribonucleotide synthase
MELAVIVTRGQDGTTVTYPVVETVNREHICHVVKAPAAVSAPVAAEAARIARAAVEAIGGVGSFGVELFLLAGDKLLLNEIAPRVHNTGHYTIEACLCSQFENHIRAVLGWPLGSPGMIVPAACMVNLLGYAEGSGVPVGLSDALKVPGTHIHVYGKTRSERGRKMGHITVLGESVEHAYARAQEAADYLRFGGKI